MVNKRQLLAIAILFFASNIYAAINHQPVRIAVSNTPTKIVITSTDLKGFARATIFARTKGSTNFITVPMLGSGRRFVGTIAAYLTKSPGLEYYIEAFDDNGQRFRFPAAGAANPVSTKVSSPSKRPIFRLLSPKANSLSEAWRPIISLTIAQNNSLLNKNSLRIYLDDAEITESLKIRGNFIQYRPPIRLRLGAHTIRATGTTLAGTTIEPASFKFFIKVRDIDEAYKKKTAEWQTEGNLNTVYQYSKVFSESNTSQVTDPNGYGTATFNFKATRNDEELFLGPVFLTTQESENQQPAQNFTFGYKNNRFETQWGNIAAQFNQLSGGGGSMLGGELVYYTHEKKARKGFRFQVDGGRVKQAVEASSENFEVGTYARRVYGGKVDYFFSKSLSVYTSALDTRDISSSISNPGSTQPLDNQALAAGFKSTKKYSYVDSVSGEVGYSFTKLKADSNSTSTTSATTTEQNQDAAWLLKASKNIRYLRTNVSADYSEYRPEFAFLFGSASSDNRTIALNGDSNLFGSVLKLTSGYSWSRDNLENQKNATTFTNTFNLVPTISFKKWPVISISETLVLQNTEGDANTASDTINNTATISMSYGFTAFKRQHNSSLSFSQNDTITKSASQKSQTRNRTISLDYGIGNLLSWLSFSMAYSINIAQTSENATITFSDTATLNLTPSIKRLRISLPLAINYSRTFDDASPSSADNETLALNISVAHNFNENQALSFSAGYTLFNDKLDSAANYQQATGTLSYNQKF